MAFELEKQPTQAPPEKSPESWLSLLGSLCTQFVKPGQTYRVTTYSLEPSSLKALYEAIGFQANFELDAIRAACLDLLQTEGHIILEVERNTSPKDLNVRYQRHWSLRELPNRSDERTKTFSKTEYRAKPLPEEALLAVARQLQIEPNELGNFLIRINFLESKFALLSPETYAGNIPGEPLFSFLIDQGAAPAQTNHTGPRASEPAEPAPALAVAASPSEGVIEPAPKTAVQLEISTKQPDSVETGKPTGKPERAGANAAPLVPAAPVAPTAPVRAVAASAPAVKRETTDNRPKYDTYSKSEVDSLLKLQAESMKDALGSKISTHQRSLQEALEAQTKSFNRLSENFSVQIESAKTKLESTTRTAQQAASDELNSFKKQLSKELEQYRTQLNKTVLPVAKALEQTPGKIAKEKQPAQQVVQVSSKRDPLLLSLLVLVLLSTAIDLALSLHNLQRLGQIENQSSQTPGKTSQQ